MERCMAQNYFLSITLYFMSENFELEKKHIYSHTVKTTVGSIEFKCDREICGKTYRNQSELHRHLDIHDNFFEKCFFCPWKGQAYQKQNTEGHYNLHAGFKDHTCEVCGHKFTLYRNLKQHFERYHQRKILGLFPWSGNYICVILS